MNIRKSQFSPNLPIYIVVPVFWNKKSIKSKKQSKKKYFAGGGGGGGGGGG